MPLTDTPWNHGYRPIVVSSIYSFPNTQQLLAVEGRGKSEHLEAFPRFELPARNDEDPEPVNVTCTERAGLGCALELPPSDDPLSSQIQ